MVYMKATDMQDSKDRHLAEAGAANHEFAAPPDSGSSDVLALARYYHGQGLSVIPIARDSKKPMIRWGEYQRNRLDARDVDRFFRDGINIAIVGGSSSGNLFVVDVDDPDTFHATFAERMKPYMDNTLVVQSASPGRFHVYLRCNVPVRCKKLKQFGCEIKGGGGYWLAPPSVAKGGQYRILSGEYEKILEVRLDEIPELGLTEWVPANRLSLSHKAQNREFALERPVDVTLRHWQAICMGRLGNLSGVSRSETEFATVYHLISMGWSKQEIHSFFSEYAHFSTKFAEKERRRQSGYFEVTFQNAESAFWRDILKDSLRLSLLKAMAVLGSESGFFAGRNAAIDKASAMYLMTIAYRSNKEEVGASLREIAENAGSAPNTVRQSLGRLCELGYVKLVRLGSFRAASVYDIRPLVDKVRNRGTVEVSRPKLWQILQWVVRKPSGGDAFRRAALGKAGHQLLQFLHLNPDSPLDAIESGVTSRRKTVRKHLERLVSLGMVEFVGGVYRAVDADLNAIASRLGTSGLALRQRQRHEAQRQAREDGLWRDFTTKQESRQESGSTDVSKGEKDE